jgi:hypothetical protein
MRPARISAKAPGTSIKGGFEGACGFCHGTPSILADGGRKQQKRRPKAALFK